MVLQVVFKSANRDVALLLPVWPSKGAPQRSTNKELIKWGFFNSHYGFVTYVVWKMHGVPMCFGGSCGLIFRLENLRQLHSFCDYQVVWQSGPAIYGWDGTQRKATKRDAAKPDFWDLQFFVYFWWHYFGSFYFNPYLRSRSPCVRFFPKLCSPKNLLCHRITLIMCSLYYENSSLSGGVNQFADLHLLDKFSCADDVNVNPHHSLAKSS
jgi:hypothetical protein